jgi:hypothetical protein
VFFWVADIETMYGELVRRGATIVYPPTVQPCGMKEFAVRDASGYVLGFGQECKSRMLADRARSGLSAALDRSAQRASAVHQPRSRPNQGNVCALETPLCAFNPPAAGRETLVDLRENGGRSERCGHRRRLSCLDEGRRLDAGAAQGSTSESIR